MKDSERNFIHEERGVEPTVMKILVGVILVTIGLGIGVTMYRRIGGQTQDILSYSVSVEPSQGTIELGNSDTATVHVETQTGYAKNVTLTSSGAPNGVTVIYNGQSSYTASCPYSVTMELTVKSSANPGTYTITVKGTSSEDIIREDSFTLKIPE